MYVIQYFRNDNNRSSTRNVIFLRHLPSAILINEIRVLFITDIHFENVESIGAIVNNAFNA